MVEPKPVTKFQISNHTKSTKLWSNSDRVTKLWPKTDLILSYSVCKALYYSCLSMVSSGSKCYGLHTLIPVGNGSGLYHEGEQGVLNPLYSSADNPLDSLIKSRPCILEVLSLKLRFPALLKGYLQLGFLHVQGILSHHKYIGECVKYMRNTRRLCAIILILMMCS